MKNLKHLFTALLLLCTTMATAHDFEVGGIYYKILSEEDKTVEVTYKGTSYSAYSNEYTGSVVIPQTVTESSTETFDAWTSTNKNNSTTSQTSYTLNVEAGNILKFDWSVSSESNYDWLIITLDGTEIVKKSGTLSGSYEKTFDTAGSHTLVVKYTKDSSQSSGNDEGKIYNITLSSVGSVNDVVYSVTSIGESAFRNCSGLTSIEIPNSVTFIGEYAFSNCSGLTSIEIPNSVTSIGDDAFYKCTGLTSIEIPNSVTSIGSEAFYGCTGLTSIEIPNSVTSIGDDAFRGCTGLTSITIPNSVTSIGEGAFCGCSGLTSITIPNSVTSIGKSAFSSCSALTSITIPNSVTSIGNAAFGGCSGLTSITIPNSVTSIGDDAFRGCTGLTSITIPNSVTSIGRGAFYDTAWYNNQPDGVIYIGSYLYSYKGTMPANTSIVVKDGTLSILGYAFYGRSGLTSIVIPNSVTSIGDYAFDGCSGLTSIVIPNSVTSIGGSAFDDCTGLTSVVIGNSVTSIGREAFMFCSGLKTVCISDLTAWCNIDFYGPYANPLYTADNLYLNGEKVTNLVIPNNVTSIGDYAFYGCTGLTSVTIPNSVTSIGRSAFEDCTGLTSVVIGNSVTSIGDYAFESCTGLTSITIPNSVTSIGRKAFMFCSALTSIEIPNSVTSIGESAFSSCSGLTSITIPNSVTSIGESAFYNCSALTSIEIPNSVTSIGESAFYGCTKLTSVAIPNSVTSIGSHAFFNCTHLTSVVIGNSVTSIGESAFYTSTGLTSITSLIPAEDLYSIISNVFNYVDKTSCTLYVPYGAKETYAATEGWKEFANIVEIIPTEVTVTINQYGSATYCSPYSLDFSEVEGLKAYAATGYKTNSQVVTLTRVQTAEAGIGLFLKAEPGEYVVPVIESTDEHSLNMLVGTLKQTTVNSTDGAMSNYKFTISDVDNAPMFCPFEDNTTFSAGEAYLQIPTAWLPSVAQKSVSIRFDEGEFTDIDEVEGESGEVKTVYDLQGRVVENPTNGIYIIDGKKVLIK